MTKRKSMMGLMALGLSMALLGGCSSSDVEEIINDPTPTVAASLVGTWETACVEDADAGIWLIQNLIINADNTGLEQEQQYCAAGCNADDEIPTDPNSFNYTVGTATTAAAGEDAVEIDVEFTGETLYSMVRFNADLLYLAESGVIKDGQTPDTREDDFSSSLPFTRQ